MELVLMILIIVNITLTFCIMTVLKKMIEVFGQMPKKIVSNLFGDTENTNIKKGE